MSVHSLRLVAALMRLAASQDAQQAEAIRLRLALAEARAALEKLGQGAEAYLANLGILRADVERLNTECRRLEEIMGRVSDAEGR
jgi:hypothetical protein